MRTIQRQASPRDFGTMVATRGFSYIPKSRTFGVMPSKRKLYADDLNRIVDPEPAGGPWIWGRTDLIIEDTAGTFADYPDE